MTGFQSIFSSFPFVPIILAIVIMAYWVHAFFVIYHLVRFGIGVKPKIFALIFFMGSMVLFMLAIFSYNSIDFSALSANLNINFDWNIPVFNFPTPTF